uniref:Protein PsbN n=1 Tax=Lepocinclis playfairiana TaxID=1403386 RepID=A0A3G3LLJ8_9EUGL|nr:photosystem II N protein [Lepocinclis playfairiana]AYQ93581.1 photosystem II N protein [Lepocinclis playfairiana]
MDITSFFSTIFISSAFISVTIFSIMTGFGPQSKELRDPFQENED